MIMAHDISFGDDLEDHIDRRYGSKLCDMVSTRNLGDQRNYAEIEPSNINASQHKVIENMEDPMSNQLPATFKTG
jgi:hypothetical protein